MKSSDRNPDAPAEPAQAELVGGADPLASEAEWSDRLMLWWEDHGRKVLAGIALVVVGVIGWQVSLIVADRRELALREEYAALADTPARLGFAAQHPDHPLAGVAQLAAADEAYAAKDYARAAELYGKAAERLAAAPYAGRARLGHGMSLLAGGDSAGAKGALTTLRDDAAAPGPVRLEAGYQLAVLLWSTGSHAEAKAAFQAVVAMPDSGFWGQRATQALEEYPELR